MLAPLVSPFTPRVFALLPTPPAWLKKGSSFPFGSFPDRNYLQHTMQSCCLNIRHCEILQSPFFAGRMDGDNASLVEMGQDVLLRRYRSRAAGERG